MPERHEAQGVVIVPRAMDSRLCGILRMIKYYVYKTIY